MANDGASTLYAVALRVARLDANGATPAGTSNLYVTNTVVSMSVTPEYEEGDEVVQKNGQGGVCLSVKQPDTLKRLTVGLTICAFDPELTEALSGGAIIASTGGTPATIGYAYEAVGQDPVPNGVSLELWTKRFVNSSPVGFAHWVFPRVYLRKSERAFGTDLQENSFEGFATENPNWGNGPLNDWTATSSRVAQWVQESTAPTGAVGYAATPTQTP